MNTKLIAVSAIFLIAFAGCSSTPTFQTGEDAEITHDGLTRMEGTVMDAVWAREDIDLTGFTTVMFEGVGFQYRNDSGPYSGRAGAGTSSVRTSSTTEFQLDDATKAVFEEEISGAFREEIMRSDIIKVVDEPGPGVLLVRGGLLDVVSRVPPEAPGRSRIFISSIGEASLVLEVVDPMSNTVLARAIDRRAGDRIGGMESNTVTNRAEVRRLGRRWGSILRVGLENMLTDGIAD